QHGVGGGGVGGPGVGAGRCRGCRGAHALAASTASGKQGKQGEQARRRRAARERVWHAAGLARIMRPHPQDPSPAMKIEKDRVVRFHYAVSVKDGGDVESSEGREPLAILAGHGNIIPGLEKAMEGREAGDRFEVDVAAADAYGEKREGMTQRVPKKHFRDARLAPGMQVVLNTNFGPRPVTIQKVGMSVVDVDLNHPM